MKVLIVNKFLHPNGGSETYIFKLGEELRRQGHEVEYFGMDHPDRIVGNKLDIYVKPMDFHTGKIQKVLYPFKIIYSREARKKIGVIIRNFQPDVVHLNNFNFQLTPSIIYEIKKYGIPIIYTAHDSQLVCPNHLLQQYSTGKRCEECLEYGYGRCMKNKCIHGSRVKSMLGTWEALLYRKLGIYKRIDRIISPSEFLKGKLETNPDLKGKICVLHNFVDKMEDNRGTVIENKAISGSYVLYFGRYSEEKGVKTLLEVCKRTPDIRYVFAGSGSLKDDVSKMSNIIEVGFLDQPRLSGLIRNARFVVFPSEWYENCPFTVMESQLYGSPLICSNIGGTKELVKEGETCLFFEPGNIEELQKRIEQLWRDDELVNRMKENCKKVRFATVEEYTHDFLKQVDQI